jgi:hypothetical protein
MRKSIEILNEIDKTHGLKNLTGKGLISWTLLLYRDLYNEFDVFVRMGKGTEEAADLTADKFKVDKRTVYRAIKSMNNE